MALVDLIAQPRIAWKKLLPLGLSALLLLPLTGYATDELEPNDTASTAQSISPSTAVTGSISTSDDADVFAIELSQAGQLTLSFSSVEWDGDGWIYEIFDPQGNLLAEDRCTYSTCQDGITLSAGIAGAGTHYVRVRSGSSYYAPSKASIRRT